MSIDLAVLLPYPIDMSKTGKIFEELVAIMARLRAPDGCPWDREQSYMDIAAHTLEETHEVLDAIDKSDFEALCEELGDLMLQIVFYAQIATEEKRFTIDNVMERIKVKLIHRHPHVFGDVKVSGPQEVLENWEFLKKKEGKKTVLGGVPNTLPALLKAFRLGEKTSRVGFDWEDADGILSKVEEEARELHLAKKTGKTDDVDDEYGDLLFTIANLGRFLGIDPEGSLRRATDKFTKRFSFMEKQIEKEGLEMQLLSPKRWDDLWNQAKKHSRK